MSSGGGIGQKKQAPRTHERPVCSGLQHPESSSTRAELPKLRPRFCIQLAASSSGPRHLQSNHINLIHKPVSLIGFGKGVMADSTTLHVQFGKYLNEQGAIHSHSSYSLSLPTTLYGVYIHGFAVTGARRLGPTLPNWFTRIHSTVSRNVSR